MSAYRCGIHDNPLYVARGRLWAGWVMGSDDSLKDRDRPWCAGWAMEMKDRPRLVTKLVESVRTP